MSLWIPQCIKIHAVSSPTLKTEMWLMKFDVNSKRNGNAIAVWEKRGVWSLWVRLAWLGLVLPGRTLSVLLSLSGPRKTGKRSLCRVWLLYFAHLYYLSAGLFHSRTVACVMSGDSLNFTTAQILFNRIYYAYTSHLLHLHFASYLENFIFNNIFYFMGHWRFAKTKCVKRFFQIKSRYIFFEKHADISKL